MVSQKIARACEIFKRAWTIKDSARFIWAWIELGDAKRDAVLDAGA